MTNNFMKRLLATQAALKAPKNQENKFGGYRYRSCEDILEAVKLLLLENGLLLMITDEPVLIGDRVYIKATATIMDALGQTPDAISVSAYAREAESKKGMDEAQVTGSASSYARKYALNGLFLIDDTKDPDATNDHGKQTPSKPKPRKQTPEEPTPVEELRGLYKEALAAGISKDGIEGWRISTIGCEVRDMTPEQIKDFAEYLKGMIRDKKSLDAA